jgi:hypothetical protein
VPYLAASSPSWTDIAATADRRWTTLAERHPDLLPAVELQRSLLAIVFDLAQKLERHPLPRLSLPPKYLAAKLLRGVPALAGEPIPLPAAALKDGLLRFCAALQAGGAAEVAGHIGSALETGRLDAGSLLTACLSRDQAAVRTGATHMDLAPDLVWLVGELGVGPLAYMLQRSLFSCDAGTPLGDALAAWNQGYCPACGSWAAMAEVVEGHRCLRCSFCAATWERTVYACVYCDTAGEPFVTAAPDAERKDRRLECCSACGGYLKTVDVPALTPFPLVAIADMETMDLDVAAMEHQYGRPPMKEFKTGRT